MYIIKCQEDGSFCMVENEDVICDGTVIQIGDCVLFVWNSKRYTGQIVKCSGKWILLIHNNIKALHCYQNIELNKEKEILTCFNEEALMLKNIIFIITFHLLLIC